jgi:hypothetical protein
VRFGEDGDPIRARIVGEDPSSDLALLKIDPSKVKGGLQPLELGDSKNLRPGEATIAIGSPFGLSGSVTTGVVSALDREITAPNDFPISGVVQTDAAINPGNSGGPLLDAQGRVIGVNSQIATNGAPDRTRAWASRSRSTRSARWCPVLERDGKIERPYLGVSTSDATGSQRGVVIRAVVPGGPAIAPSCARVIASCRSGIRRSGRRRTSRRPCWSASRVTRWRSATCEAPGSGRLPLSWARVRSKRGGDPGQRESTDERTRDEHRGGPPARRAR